MWSVNANLRLLKAVDFVVDVVLVVAFVVVVVVNDVIVDLLFVTTG